MSKEQTKKEDTVNSNGKYINQQDKNDNRGDRSCSNDRVGKMREIKSEINELLSKID